MQGFTSIDKALAVTAVAIAYWASKFTGGDFDLQSIHDVVEGIVVSAGPLLVYLFPNAGFQRVENR